MNEPIDLAAILTDAVRAALYDPTGSEASARSDQAAAHETATALAVALPVAAEAGAGAFVLRATERTARALAVRVLGRACPEPDPALVRDCLGEFLNVIAGQAKTRLFGTRFHFALGTPTVAPTAPDGEGVRLGFGCALGDFELHVRLPAR